MYGKSWSAVVYSAELCTVRVERGCDRTPLHTHVKACAVRLCAHPVSRERLIIYLHNTIHSRACAERNRTKLVYNMGHAFLYWDSRFFVLGLHKMDTLYCRAAAAPWIHDRRGHRRVRPSGLGAWAHIRARWLMTIHFLLLAGAR